jgi:hypothetical protein
LTIFNLPVKFSKGEFKMKLFKVILAMGALFFVSGAYAAPCRAPASYACFKEGWDKSCIEYFDAGTAGDNNCSSQEVFLADGCPAAERVGSCEVSFAGADMIYHTYAPNTPEIAKRNCARLDGITCEAN